VSPNSPPVCCGCVEPNSPPACGCDVGAVDPNIPPVGACDVVVLESNPPCACGVDPNKPAVCGAEEVVVVPKRPVVGLLAGALPNIPPPAAGVVLDPLYVLVRDPFPNLGRFISTRCIKTRLTTHNSELAELVFMLKPPGPLMDRASAMVFHARLRLLSKENRV
jgi:hypothetical protein